MYQKPVQQSHLNLTSSAKLLTVTADKQLYFNDRPITQEALEAEIAQWNKDQKVTLKLMPKPPSKIL